MGFKKWKIFIY